MQVVKVNDSPFAVRASWRAGPRRIAWVWEEPLTLWSLFQLTHLCEDKSKALLDHYFIWNHEDFFLFIDPQLYRLEHTQWHLHGLPEQKNGDFSQLGNI